MITFIFRTTATVLVLCAAAAKTPEDMMIALIGAIIMLLWCISLQLEEKQ